MRGKEIWLHLQGRDAGSFRSRIWARSPAHSTCWSENSLTRPTRKPRKQGFVFSCFCRVAKPLHILFHLKLITTLQGKYYYLFYR